MARKRYLAIGFFKNEILSSHPMAARLLFQGMWLLADRRGILEFRPRRLAAEILPYDAIPNPDELLGGLERDGFIRVYEAEGSKYALIANFHKHQSPHPNEQISDCPDPPEGCNDLLTSNGNYITGTGDSDTGSEDSGISNALPSLTLTRTRNTKTSCPDPESGRGAGRTKPKPELTTEQVDWFTRFWEAYWRREAKKPAMKAFRCAVKSLADFEMITAAIRNQSSAMLAKEPQHRPLAATWLNQQRWLDEESPPTTGAGKTQHESALDQAMRMMREEKGDA